MNNLIARIRILERLIALYKALLRLRQKSEIDNIIIHHSATSRDKTTFEAINNYHKQKWGIKSAYGYFCGYQYVITGRGKIYRARKDTEMGIHTKGHNYRTIAICLTGNFMKEKPTEEQKRVLKQLLDAKIEKYDLKKEQIKGHRNFSNTLCPGDKLMNWIENNYKRS